MYLGPDLLWKTQENPLSNQTMSLQFSYLAGRPKGKYIYIYYFFYNALDHYVPIILDTLCYNLKLCFRLQVEFIHLFYNGTLGFVSVPLLGLCKSSRLASITLSINFGGDIRQATKDKWTCNFLLRSYIFLSKKNFFQLYFWKSQPNNLLHRK